MKKSVVKFLKSLEIGSAIAIRLTKLTGKSDIPVHPKHLLFTPPWYVKYLSKGDIVIDLGSGNGQNTIKASKFVKTVIGFEKNKNLIVLAKKSAESLKAKNVIFKNANLETKIDIKQKSVDKVLFLDVLEHLYKRKQILEEIKRVLKPGGILLLAVPNSQTSWKKAQRAAGISSFSDPDHKVEYSKTQITALLKKSGFNIIKTSYSSYDTPLRGLVDVIGGFSISFYKILTNWRLRAAKRNPTEASGFQIAAKNT